MDYIFFSAIMGCMLGSIFLTYNIACQYCVNLEARNKHLPLKLQHNFTKTEIRSVLPIWHSDVHWLKCHSQNLVQYQEGAAKTDGEAPERFWGGTNEISYATKEMGEGTQHDAIEDRLDYHNHQKNIKLGNTLDQKLHLALVEEANQKREFEQVNSTIDDELLEQWEDIYSKWYKDCEKNPTPFASRVKDGISEAEVRLQMKRDEADEARKSKTTTCDKSIVFSDDRTGAGRISEERRNGEEVPAAAEDIKLWLPSELPDRERVRGCKHSMADMEASLHEVQCSDALSQIHGRLHAKRYLITYRNTHVTGQRGGMKARGLIDTVGERVEVYVEKYRAVCAALIALKGEEVCKSYLPLNKEDLSLDEERLMDEAATKKLARIGTKAVQIHGGNAVREGSGSKKRVLLWIWTKGVGSDSLDDEQVLADKTIAVCVKWSKAKARSIQWWEEVRILEEEMRRVIRFLRWQEKKWKKRADGVLDDEEAAMKSGLRAYALKQAWYSSNAASRFEALWKQKDVSN
ncbi:hypothetical protein C8J56DRAFT_894348 [Mycena floridula]|nr:hypothetical protein C8J56DRAFT_894348 [Mycena floridula]